MTQQINLLDPSLVPLRDWCNGKFVLGLGLALTLGTAGHVAYETQALTSFLAKALPTVPDTDTAQQAQADAPLAELRARVNANQGLLQAVGSFAELPRDNATRLRALIAAMPDTLWLQEVEFSVERGVRISGSALDATALAGFSARLGGQPAFRGLPLHVFALQPEERNDGTATADAPARSAPQHYGFLLSSIDAAHTAGGPR